MKNQNRKRKYANGVPVIRAKKDMGELHAVHKSIAVGKLGKHLSASAWAILNHAFAWSTWDGCEYRSGIRSIGTALALDPRQVKRGLSELVALGIFTPQERAPTASKREATVYIVSAPRRFDDGRLQLITGEVAPAKHAGRTARNANQSDSPGPRDQVSITGTTPTKSKSVAVLMSESKAAKAALVKQRQEQNVERVRVEQAQQEQERLERERIEQAQQAQYKQEQEQREKERLEQEELKQDKHNQRVKEFQERERVREMTRGKGTRIEFPSPNESKGEA